MSDRNRARVGRDVYYTPTAAEEAQGLGPWTGRIVDVNTDGTFDLAVYPRNPSGDVVLRKAGVSMGGGKGQFSFDAGPAAV